MLSFFEMQYIRLPFKHSSILLLNNGIMPPAFFMC